MPRRQFVGCLHSPDMRRNSIYQPPRDCGEFPRTLMAINRAALSGCSPLARVATSPALKGTRVA